MSLSLPAATPRLAGPRVVLRSPSPDDIEARRRLGNDPSIIRAFGGSPAFDTPQPMTVAEAEHWYESQTHDEGPLHWFIEHEGRFVGNARLRIESETDRRARFAIGILDGARLGCGLGTESTRLMLDYGFGVIGLHRIALRVLATNTRARRCYRRCGFVDEGIERDSALVDGQWQDDIMMAVLAHEHAPWSGG
jgi:[ribosomal protein S5]-alanine N-acetyltransferase